MALDNNAKARNSRRAVEAAEQTKKATFTKYFPEVSATGVGLLNEKPMLTTTVQTGDPTYPTMEVGLLKSGIIGAVTAMQPLYAGGRISTGNRLAQTALDISRLQQRITDNAVLLATEQYYWQLVALKEKLKTIDEAETLLERIHHDVTLSVEAGLITRNDLLRVELEQNKLQSARLKAENGLAILKLSMAQHIGADATTFDVAPLSGDTLPPPDRWLVNHTAVLPQSAEYQLLAKSVDAAQLQVKLQAGEARPSVAVGAVYNYYGFDNGKPTEMKDNFGMAMATVSVPLSGWWGNSHNVKKKQLEVQQAVNTRQETEELLLLQMQHLHNGVVEAYRQTQLAQNAITVAEDNARQNEAHYKAGISILSDLLDARNLLQQSHDQYAEAATNYFLKLSEYKIATNQQ